MTPLASQLVVDPKEFFRGKIHDASNSLKVVLDEELEFYLVNLLCDFITPEKLSEEIGTEDSILGTPLAFLLQKAYESEVEEQKIRLFRRLGDTSLYVAGYFQDYFNDKTFDVGYYMQVGSIAYQSVYNLLSKRTSTPRVYGDLSDNFPQLVDLVAEVSETPESKANRDILAVYDRWNRSNSDRLRKILERMGITPIKTNTKTAQ